ncbi:MAG TPA: oxidoreductase, partial [Anaerolineales bacterium]|nr:oxidoreductase [Anaerolineales bacterium]
MKNWTKNDISNLNGKVFIITGANSGIGYESSLALAEKGATVVMACRNSEKARRAMEMIKAAVPAAKVETMQLDLANLKSVQEFADTFKKKYDKLDVLVNNGGPIIAKQSVTEDGFESHFGVGHLGHFVLTALLLDVILKTPSSRIVTVGSRMHAKAKISWDDLMSERSYNPMKAYPQSMLAKILFAFELSRRLDAKGTTSRSIAVHPGLANTGWVENNLNGFMKIIGKLMSITSYQSAEMGALPLLYAGTDPNIKPGGYYGPENDTKGFPV